MKLIGEEHAQTLLAANNYANNLLRLQRVDEAKALLRRTIPVTRRVLSDQHDPRSECGGITQALLLDEGTTLDDFREAESETLESVAQVVRAVFGRSHPETPQVYGQNRARAALREAEGA